MGKYKGKYEGLAGRLFPMNGSEEQIPELLSNILISFVKENGKITEILRLLTSI